MQKSFLARFRISFDAHFYASPGDILVFDSVQGGRATVYRNGSIVTTFKVNELALNSMVKSRWLEPQTAVTPAKPVATLNLRTTKTTTSLVMKEAVDLQSTDLLRKVEEDRKRRRNKDTRVTGTEDGVA